jgi:hypothetical protein
VGYLLDSGDPNGLWFRFRPGLGVKNVVERHRLYIGFDFQFQRSERRTKEDEDDAQI